MGADREQRVLAAGDSVTVHGKEYKLRPVVAQHLADLEREALKFYKRQYLETFVDNADLLGDKVDIQEKVNEVAKWTSENLPQKLAYDASDVPVTKKMEKWIVEKYGSKPADDKEYKAAVTAALDMGDITPDKVREITGVKPKQGKVRFDQWWVTASIAGMIAIIRSSLQDCTKQEVEGVKDWPFLKVVNAARVVERLTTVDLGNG